MKKKALSIMIAALVALSSLMSSCKTKQPQEETNSDVEMVEVAYTCPMHPEVTGKEGDTCSQCGMALEKTEGDAGEAEGEAEHDHGDHD